MQQRLRHAKCSSTAQNNKTLNGLNHKNALIFKAFFFFVFCSVEVSIYIFLRKKTKFSSIYQFMFVLPRKAKIIPFINFISLFCRGELCSPLCFCFYAVTIKKRTEFPSAFIHFSITPGQQQPSGFSGGKNSSTGNSTP